MGDNSHIEWTDATWNPVTGCTRVSPGCDHCYIDRSPPFRMAHRRFNGAGIGATTGVLIHPERLDQPLRWRKPRRIFVNSLSDLFHDDVPDEYIARVFAVMALTPRHTFQVLTKRHARMRSLLSSAEFHLYVDTAMRNYGDAETEAWPLPNVWVGVTVENQQWADIRIPALLDTPAAVRFLSCEPLLGPVDLTDLDVQPGQVADAITDCEGHDGPYCTCPPRVDWVIAGGESGPGARPMHPDWARGLRDQCAAAGVPFHFKQWGEWVKVELRHAEIGDRWVLPENRALVVEWEPGQVGAEAHRWGPHRDELMRRVGKRAAGRVLDGRTHDDAPAGGSR